MLVVGHGALGRGDGHALELELSLGCRVGHVADHSVVVLYQLIRRLVACLVRVRARRAVAALRVALDDLAPALGHFARSPRELLVLVPHPGVGVDKLQGVPAGA